MKTIINAAAIGLMFYSMFIAPAHGADMKDIAEAMQKDGGIRESHRIQQAYEDCYAACIKESLESVEWCDIMCDRAIEEKGVGFEGYEPDAHCMTDCDAEGWCDSDDDPGGCCEAYCD